MNSGIEHAALMVSEEKTQHDSRKRFVLYSHKYIFITIHHLIIVLKTHSTVVKTSFNVLSFVDNFIIFIYFIFCY